MMYFSCRKPHHSGELRCVKTTCSSPFTRGEREKRQKTLSSNRACLHQNFFRTCLRPCYKTGQRWCDTATALLIWFSFSQSQESLGCPAGLSSVPARPLCSLARRNVCCAVWLCRATEHAVIPAQRSGWLCSFACHLHCAPSYITITKAQLTWSSRCLSSSGCWGCGWVCPACWQSVQI